MVSLHPALVLTINSMSLVPLLVNVKVGFWLVCVACPDVDQLQPVMLPEFTVLKSLNWLLCWFKHALVPLKFAIGKGFTITLIVSVFIHPLTSADVTV